MLPDPRARSATAQYEHHMHPTTLIPSYYTYWQHTARSCKTAGVHIAPYLQHSSCAWPTDISGHHRWRWGTVTAYTCLWLFYTPLTPTVLHPPDGQNTAALFPTHGGACEGAYEGRLLHARGCYRTPVPGLPLHTHVHIRAPYATPLRPALHPTPTIQIAPLLMRRVRGTAAHQLPLSAGTSTGTRSCTHYAIVVCHPPAVLHP